MLGCSLFCGWDMLINKSLMQEILDNEQRDDDDEDKNNIGILVIDEDSTAISHQEIGNAFIAPQTVTSNQQRIIMLAQRLKIPVWLIQYDHSGLYPVGRTDASDPDRQDLTRQAIRGLLPANTEIITKHTPNSFTNTRLEQRLDSKYIDTLLVMGFHANACVYATIGKKELPKGMDDGATHKDFKVLTGQFVLHGDDAYWKHNEGVNFYQQP